MLLSLIDRNIVNTSEPFKNGKALMRELKELWRYRIGDYRILCRINKEDIIIEIVKIAHQKSVYIFRK
ncbi:MULTISPECIES: type II toxin-antitoxin system RelE family toxin [Amylolactobacillus]|uniref:type II toxin-antitoxin system RelE family toxin n=1 Tax=Amylolactobacillus TaxID=2767876 RepID=UPI003AB017EC